jgi:autotransporter-associated beta strand protein
VDAPANYVDQIYYDTDVVVNGGSLDLNGRSEGVDGLSGGISGNITNTAVGSTSTLYSGQNNSGGTYSGSLQNVTGATLGYVKLGTGMQILNGANTYAGATEVRGGVLEINGTSSGTAVTVKSGATLRGAGSSGALTVEPGGTFSPGNTNPGLFTANGDVAFSDSTFALDIAGPGAADQFALTGNLSLNGTVNLTLNLGYTPAAGDTFLVVNNLGANSLNGFFSYAGTPLNNGDHIFTGTSEFAIQYNSGTGNDVTLTAVPEPSNLVTLLAGCALLLGIARPRLRADPALVRSRR